jgi:uncharacterized protein (TIGR02646 family)
MIFLNRVRTTTAISAKFRGDGKKNKDKELMFAQREFLRGSIDKINFSTAYWKSAKTQLKKETKGKCAYCEANVENVAYGDVEHHRPKSVYWWLAYTYDNYLFACQKCNQEYKKDRFPVGGLQLATPLIEATTSNAVIEQMAGNISPDPIDIASNYSLQMFEQGHKDEVAFLLHPYFDKPELYFAYEADDTLKEVKIIPSRAEHAEYVKATEEFYGLNRSELKRDRYKIFKLFKILKMSYYDLEDGSLKREVEEQIVEMKSNKYLFSGMNNYFDTRV